MELGIIQKMIADIKNDFPNVAIPNNSDDLNELHYRLFNGGNIKNSGTDYDFILDGVECPVCGSGVTVEMICTNCELDLIDYKETNDFLETGYLFNFERI